MKLFSTKLARNLLSLTIVALLVSSCSGSDGSSSGNPADPASTDVGNVSLLDSADSQGTAGLVTTEPSESQDTEGLLQESTFDETINTGDAAGITDGSIADNSSTTGSDPESASLLSQNLTQVNVEITVPAYQSNALQVQLVWGEFELSASWIGDELWMATIDLPTDTEHPLTITFFDNNGDLVLGSYETIYRTGINAAEIHTVTADQLNTSQWDTDGDGTSNLDELVAETDPLIDEDSLLTVVDSARFSFGTYSTRVEEFIKDERPFSGAFNGTADVDIDTDGNGTIYFYDGSDFYNQLRRNATRTNTGDSILWEGKTSDYDGDYTLLNTFSSEVSIVDQNTRLYVEEDYLSFYGTYTDSSTESSNLIGVLVEGTSYCKPISGTASRKTFSNRGSSGTPDTTSITISKEKDDLYWRVKSVAVDKTEVEYFARELRLLSDDVQEVALFKCDFVDF